MTITIRLTEEEKDRIKEYGDKHDLTMSQVVRRALRLFFRTIAQQQQAQNNIQD